jgi:hypothetical protein
MGDDDVIAGDLPQSLHLNRAPPGKRIEPIQRTGQASDRLRQNIATQDMRQFVQQHLPPAFGRPLVGIARQQHGWTQIADNHR